MRTFEEAIDNLSHNENFYIFLRWIDVTKRQELEDMRGASTDLIQQVAGSMLKADDILAAANWEIIQKRFMAAEE